MKRSNAILKLAGALALCVAPAVVSAGNATIAVSANFSEVMDNLQARFETLTGHELTIVTGSTGKIYAQIVHGAPFDVFLAADSDRPEMLVEDGLADGDSRFTYATGKLVLWSIDPSFVINGPGTFDQEFHHLAIANPQHAPYGIAAKEALTGLHLYDEFGGRIVMGENIGQAHALVASGNAEIGIVALANIYSARNTSKGSHWVIPAELYSPIDQVAVVINRAKNNKAAHDFMDFLQINTTKALIRTYGYEVD